MEKPYISFDLFLNQNSMNVLLIIHGYLKFIYTV